MMSSKTGKQLKFAVFSFLVAGLAGLLALVPAFFVGTKAEAVSAADMAALRTVIDNYITSQYDPADYGEAGYLIDATALASRLDSNHDGAYLSEGDDVCQVPVLVDVLPQPAGANFIPGTNVSYAYSTIPTNIDSIRSSVDAHWSGGFSTDIVSYCATGHTESPVVMFLGAYAQAGGFYGVTPKSYGLKWGKGGWTSTNGSSGSFPTGPPASPGTSSAPGVSGCEGLSLPALVACRAGATIATVGIGTTSGAGGSYQPIDLRPAYNAATTGSYVVGTSNWLPSLEDPLLGVFGSGQSYLPSGSPNKLVFANATQHSAGMAAEGAAMLGYSASYLRWGLPAWNTALVPLQCNNCGAHLPTFNRDTTPPVITSMSVTDIASNNVVFNRTTSEAATTKLEIVKNDGTPTSFYNDTVLHVNNSTDVTNLDPSSTYYWTLTVYDGSANRSVAYGSFTTADSPPVIHIYWPPGPIEPPGVVSGTATATWGTITSVEIHIDDSTTACTLDSLGNFGCPVPDGVHWVMIVVRDSYGNQFEEASLVWVEPDEKPALSVSLRDIYWANYADYESRLLSVVYGFSNNGDAGAYAVQITGSTATMGVVIYSELPAPVGYDETVNGLILKYLVPPGVGSFRTSLEASAQNAYGTTYTYP
jgi:hypothetical protein